jgi:hypothetical protein
MREDEVARGGGAGGGVVMNIYLTLRDLSRIFSESMNLIRS